jgi:hypothetical protein
MSRNIATAGHDLVLHDLRREAAAGLVADGAAWAASPRTSPRPRSASPHQGSEHALSRR